MRCAREGEADKTVGRVGADPAAIVRSAKTGNGQTHSPAASLAGFDGRAARCQAIHMNVTCCDFALAARQFEPSGSDVCLSPATERERQEQDIIFRAAASWP